MQSITTVTQKGQITLPLAFRQFLNLEPYDRVRVFLDKHKVVIEPIVDALDLAGSIKPTIATPVLKAREKLEKTYNRV